MRNSCFCSQQQTSTRYLFRMMAGQVASKNLFFFALIAILLVLFTSISCELVPKICPDEPVLGPTEQCPAVCNGGCSTGTCIINNPLTSVVCPDSLPCRVVCDTAVTPDGMMPCTAVTVTCSKAASCDLILVQSAGTGQTALDCNDTPYSCSALCDSTTNIHTMYCNDTASCNCFSSCKVRWNCVPGLSCPRDACFEYLTLFNPCTRGLTSGELKHVQNPDLSCDCVCKDESLERVMKYDSASNPELWYCRDPAKACSTDADCGYPLKGRCTGLPQECVCFNPYGGDFCTEHLCPYCHNGAFCGNTTAEPCVCTGAWTGPNCTIPLLLNSSADAEGIGRCDLPVFDGSAAALAPSSLLGCPYPCTQCSTDEDGTPVCLIRLPLPATMVAFVATCPTTHRCIAHCAEGRQCMGTVLCSGDLPCDLVFSSTTSGVIFRCNSSSICRTTCGNLLFTSKAPPQLSDNSVSMKCAYPGGSCICEDSHSCLPNCTAGQDCNGDPCASLLCTGGAAAVFNSSSGSCSCECVRPFVRAAGTCIVANITDDCALPCANGGFCKDGQCWCPPGRSGIDCSSRDDCVQVNTSSVCPMSCDWCAIGVCFIRMNRVRVSISFSCPVGWPCVFLCDSTTCHWASVDIICPSGSGPCELWCWDYVEAITDLSPRTVTEPRRMGPCTNHILKCADPATGCRARCTRSGATSVYQQFRTIRGIHCGGINITSQSMQPLDRCGSCGTDSCFIGEGDPCYDQTGFLRQSWPYGYLPSCPKDNNGKWLQLTSNNLTNTCGCDCGDGRILINGSCNYVGCNPTCQNSGVCMSNSKCQCFGGWTGRDCTSRCFFPVTANVTSCKNGIYHIFGELKLQDTNLYLFQQVVDLVTLEIEGTLKTVGNSVLSLIANETTQNSTKTVRVSQNITLEASSAFETSITLHGGSLVAVLVNVSGELAPNGASLKLQANLAQIQQQLNSSTSGNVKVDIIAFGSSQGQFADVQVDLTDATGESCSRINAAQSISSSALSVLFTIDDSQCSSPSAVSNVSAVGIGVGVAVGFIIISVAGVVIAAAVMPAFRKKVFPYLESRKSKSAGAPLQEVESAEPQRRPKSSWNPAINPRDSVAK